MRPPFHARAPRLGRLAVALVACGAAAGAGAPGLFAAPAASVRGQAPDRAAAGERGPATQPHGGGPGAPDGPTTHRRPGTQRPLNATVGPPVVTAYGAAGTFGAAGGLPTTPSGHRFAAQPVAGWGFLPGQAAYFPAVAPDGTVVIANEPQTDNQLLPTARQMVLSTFDPGRLAFSNVVVPTTTGRTEVGGPWASASGLVGGADASDVELVQQDGQWRVAFTSAMPYWGWDARAAGVYPTLGYLRQDARGEWTTDGRRSRTAADLAARSPQHAPACREESVAGRAPVGTCHMPAEFAQLPRSRALVVTQYAASDAATPSGRISVVDTGGRVRASLAYPRITLRGGRRLTVHPREVEVDPTGRRGDERFVVIFDAVDGRSQSPPFAMQEFTYDHRRGTIKATSLPVLSGDRSSAGRPLGFETARYDARGSLWAAQAVNGTLQGGAVTVYRRTGRASRSGSVLGSRRGCAAPRRWRGERWGATCPPDERITAAAALGVGRSLVEDRATRTMLLTTMSGSVLPIAETNGGAGHHALPAVDLGLDWLADRDRLLIGPRKTALDSRSRQLWIPIQQLASHATCADWPCPPAALDQWLYRVDLRRVTGG